MYSDFNKITNYYVLYGKFDKYWEVPGKYSYSEFNKVSGTDNVTIWINNTTSLSPYPEHITYNTIDEYKTEAESGKETEIIQKLNTALKDGLGVSEPSINGKDDITSENLAIFKTAIEENKSTEIQASDKKEVIEALLNECAKWLKIKYWDGVSAENRKIIVSDDYSTFSIGGTEAISFTDGTNTYTIKYSGSNITITKSGGSSPIFTIDISKENPEIIENTVSDIKAKVEENKENEIVETLKTKFGNLGVNGYTAQLGTITGTTITAELTTLKGAIEGNK